MTNNILVIVTTVRGEASYIAENVRETDRYLEIKLADSDEGLWINHDHIHRWTAREVSD